MKTRLACMTLLAFFLSAPAIMGDPSHISPGVFVDPVANTVVCDSGPLAAPDGPTNAVLRIMLLQVAAQSVDSLYVIEHRNAANDANVTTADAPNGEIFGIAVHGTNGAEIKDYNVIIYNDQERVRVRLFAGFTGRVLCRISY